VTPVLWCVFLYYALGLLEAVNWFSKFIFIRDRHTYSDLCSTPVEKNALIQTSMKAAPILIPLAGILLISWGFSFIDRLIPIAPRYPATDPQQIAKAVLANGALDDRVDQVEVDSFLGDPAARVMAGETLFPRFYQANQGEMFFNTETSRFFIPQPYPRLIFHLMGAQGVTGVILPIDQSPEIFPHQADVVVFGCQQAEYLQAILVVLKIKAANGEPRDIVYANGAVAKLSCSD
jgi:hypothetical protein